MKTNKILLKVFLVLCLLISFGAVFTAFAADELTEGIFTYTVNDTTKTATITQIRTTDLSEIRIPETIDEYVVTKLGSKVCVGSNSEPYNIYIPKTINNTCSLNYAFLYNKAKSFFVDSENPYYSNDEYGIIYDKDKTKIFVCPYSFENSEFTVPYGVTFIDWYAFSKIPNLKKISFPDTLKTICNQAFSYSRLESVSIPESVTYVGSNAFISSTKLKEIEIPGTLEELSGSAFSDCYSLEKVVVQEGITVLNLYAFENDKALKSVYLPSSLQKISRGAFGNCISLNEIHYAGSEEDWKKIDINTDQYYEDREVVIDTVNIIYNTTVNSDDGLDFNFQNKVLTITGNGDITNLEKNRWNYFPADKESISTVILSGNITSVGSDFFADMPSLGTVIVASPTITFDANAFLNCTQLENIVLFGASSFDETAVSSCAETVNIFENQGFSHDFSSSSGSLNVVSYDFQNGTLRFSGALALDTYKLLDLTAAFALQYDNIEKIRFSTLTLDGMKLYYYSGDIMRPVEENTLTECEIYPSLTNEKDGAGTFNKLGEAIADKSVTEFFLVMTSESHGDIDEPPIEIKDDDDNKAKDFVEIITQALRWIVTLLNKLFKLFGRR